MNDEDRKRARSGNGAREVIPPDPDEEIDAILEVIPDQNETSKVAIGGQLEDALTRHAKILLQAEEVLAESYRGMIVQQSALLGACIARQERIREMIARMQK